MHTAFRYSPSMLPTTVATITTLNAQQHQAATYGLNHAGNSATGNAEILDQSEAASVGPLLVLAGAGTGKTTTVAHRVAQLIKSGVPAERILLMTFSRRAAREMTDRAIRALTSPTILEGESISVSHRFPWAGTYHSIANKLLREYAQHVALAPEFSILDRSDAADLMDVCRQELSLTKLDKRFPRKDACLEIYSLCTNRQQSLEDILKAEFSWCVLWHDELRTLFKSYVSLKQQTQSLDYDDLLLYWYYMMQESWLATTVGAKFEHILVDEYQDTNLLQAAILKTLKPDGKGVTVVGDDAQSIYSFRAAEVANIRLFTKQYTTAVEVIDLEQNYRSHQAILDFSNQLMHQQKHVKSRTLRSARQHGMKPYYVTVEDDFCQAKYVVQQILANREDGLLLREQAVLFRNSHHSDTLEIELSRRNIPFVKYGGLKFLETRHIKDVMCLLRWSVNPQDRMAAFRSMQLLSGIGPTVANKAWQFFVSQQHTFSPLEAFKRPVTQSVDWLALCELLGQCAARPDQLHLNLDAISTWYHPHLLRMHVDATSRWFDIEQLLQIASAYQDAQDFLAQLTLDPPNATGDLAGDPLKDEDYLILSTVHSAKGQEWNSVFLLNVVDGSFPSEFATGNEDLVEEERRVLYVAATRAKDQLHLMAPLKFYLPQQRRHGGEHVYGAQSRFITPSVLDTCERKFFGESQLRSPLGDAVAQLDLPSKIARLW